MMDSCVRTRPATKGKEQRTHTHGQARSRTARNECNATDRLNFTLDTDITTKDRFKALRFSKDTEYHHLRKH